MKLEEEGEEEGEVEEEELSFSSLQTSDIRVRVEGLFREHPRIKTGRITASGC